uniref:NIDO domain-containing protein n=1 Tax=Astatotilapia calliptera TaxID=8154 RepID=A0AAX7USN0_ASTCA
CGHLSFTCNLWAKSAQTICTVNHNGHLTFDASWSSYTPQLFPMYGSRDIIAPFWTDLDNRGNGQIYYNQYTSGSVLQQATQDINQYFPGLNFNANWVFVATWYQVAYYPTSGTVSHLLLNYAINMNVTCHFQAGYDTVNSVHHFSIPGSFSGNATGQFSNFRLSSNVHVPGRWAFRTDHGSRGPLYPTSGTVSSAVDDGSSPPITLLRPFFYFGRTYNSSHNVSETSSLHSGQI